MELDKSDIVESLNGRDRGKKFFVIEIEDDFVHIADGKGRKLENPKRKKQKHVRFAGRSDSPAAQKLRDGEKVQNSEIRRALAVYAAGEGQTQGGL